MHRWTQPSFIQLFHVFPLRDTCNRLSSNISGNAIHLLSYLLSSTKGILCICMTTYMSCLFYCVWIRRENGIGCAPTCRTNPMHIKRDVYLLLWSKLIWNVLLPGHFIFGSFCFCLMNSFLDKRGFISVLSSLNCFCFVCFKTIFVLNKHGKYWNGGKYKCSKTTSIHWIK